MLTLDIWFLQDKQQKWHLFTKCPTQMHDYIAIAPITLNFDESFIEDTEGTVMMVPQNEAK